MEEEHYIKYPDISIKDIFTIYSPIPPSVLNQNSKWLKKRKNKDPNLISLLPSFS